VRSGPSRALLPALAAGAGIVLALVLGELALRGVALVSPGVRYLARAGGGPPPRRFRSLDEYLASRAEHLVPHRHWFNYWTNALGFNDEEFVVPKPAGRFRIMAVGDSFTYGLVPYPANVMTLLEQALRRACPHRDVDLLNFGIGATGVRDYRTLIELAYATYAPDLVLINFYAGNDGPEPRDGRAGPARLLRRSYLWTFAANALRLRATVPDPGALAETVIGPPSPAPPPGARPAGGRIVDPARQLRDDDPALVGPIFDEAAFTQIVANELRRLHVPADAGALARQWQRTLEDLEATRTHVTDHGGRLVITLYPSVLQVDPGLRAAGLDRLRRRRRHADLETTTLDPALPNRVVADYCRGHGLSCFDLTPAFLRASQQSPEPLYKRGDLHWTVRGNRVAAEAQAAHLAPMVCSAAAAAPRAQSAVYAGRGGQ
jgi:SGNH hydrolase-like domain, acetyltransferase AlgX